VGAHNNEIDRSIFGYLRNPLQWRSTGQNRLTGQAGLPDAFGARLQGTMISTRHISSQIGSGRQVIVNLTAFDSDKGRIGDRVSGTGGGQLSLTHGTDALRLHCGEREKLLGVEHGLCAPSENTTRV